MLLVQIRQQSSSSSSLCHHHVSTEHVWMSSHNFSTKWVSQLSYHATDFHCHGYNKEPAWLGLGKHGELS